MSQTLQWKTPVVRSAACLLLVLFVSLSCGFRKPWRSYEQQSFDSQKWKDGDGITRGTMIFDLHKNRTLSGQSRENIAGLLGEPDKKRPGRSARAAEVWLYQIETVGEKPKQYFPVSFDPQGRASSGEAHEGTMSLLVDE
ncbi:MAG TPA: hypothetical protein VGC66_20805 [Pyrinomonadaceae bacterium]|jgi:hypothetical protein